MSKIDIIKEKILFQKLLREDYSTGILKDEYLIPDTHPDVQNVLMVEAKPIIVSQEIVGNKVIVEGKIEYNIIYIPREDNMLLNSVKYTEKFTNNLELNGQEYKENYGVQCKIEHIEAKVMNERKIQIEGIMKLYFEIFKEHEFEFVKDIQGSDGVEVQRQSEIVSRIAADKQIDIISKSMIRVGMDKPQIAKILNSSMLLHKKEIKILENKVYLSCYCKIKILYLGAETKEVLLLEDDVYLSKEEEVSGVDSSMLPYVNFEMENNDIVLEEDDLGETRIINSEFLIKANVQIFANDNIEIIKDAYSTNFPMNITREEGQISIIHRIQSLDTIIKDNIYLKDTDFKPEQVTAVLGNINITDKNILDNKIIIEGLLNAKIIFKVVADEVSFSQAEGDIPFNIGMEIDGMNSNMKAIVSCNLEGIEAAIEGNTIGIKANINVIAKVSFETNKEYIAEIIEEDGEVADKKASITIYVVGKGDTLWDLAKRFKTTVAELIRINGIEEGDMLQEGNSLLIPGRATF